MPKHGAPQDCPYVQLLTRSKEKFLITSGEVFQAKFCQSVLPYKVDGVDNCASTQNLKVAGNFRAKLYIYVYVYTIFKQLLRR